jgi:hypothetical protein
MSDHANDPVGAEGIEEVQECDAEVDFGGLSVGVACCDRLSEGSWGSHLRLDPAAGVVSGPALPEGNARVPGCLQDFVSGDRGGPGYLQDRPFLRIGMIGTAPHPDRIIVCVGLSDGARIRARIGRTPCQP